MARHAKEPRLIVPLHHRPLAIPPRRQARAQWKEIEELNGQLSRFNVLRGMEVNIRADGSLHVDDDTLAQLDWVVASLHTSFDKSPTERLMTAMESPHVDCVGHMTARKLNRRDGADIELDKVFAKAVETGTFIEINSQPDRLDMRDTHARRRGGRCPDHHDRRALGQRPRLRGARSGAGAARVAHEGADPEHAVLARHRQAAHVSQFRDDGALAVDWVASYLERVRDLPVLAQVEPGTIRAALPAAAPDEPEPFAAVLADLDRVLMPGLTHSQHPRWFAYFSITGSEPSILAEILIAGLNQLGILWRTSPALQELEEVTLAWLAELLGLPAGLRGQIEDTASTSTLVALG